MKPPPKVVLKPLTPRSKGFIEYDPIKAAQLKRQAMKESFGKSAFGVSKGKRPINPDKLVHREYVEYDGKHRVIYANGPGKRGKLYGYIALKETGKDKGRVSTVWVNSQETRRGVATALFDHAVKQGYNPRLRSNYSPKTNPALNEWAKKIKARNAVAKSSDAAAASIVNTGTKAVRKGRLILRRIAKPYDKVSKGQVSYLRGAKSGADAADRAFDALESLPKKQQLKILGGMVKRGVRPKHLKDEEANGGKVLGAFLSSYGKNGSRENAYLMSRAMRNEAGRERPPGYLSIGQAARNWERSEGFVR